MSSKYHKEFEAFPYTSDILPLAIMILIKH